MLKGRYLSVTAGTIQARHSKRAITAHHPKSPGTVTLNSEPAKDGEQTEVSERNPGPRVWSHFDSHMHD